MAMVTKETMLLRADLTEMDPDMLRRLGVILLQESSEGVVATAFLGAEKIAFQDTCQVEVQITIPGDTDSHAEEQITNAIGNFMEAFDFELKGETEPVYGSFFQRLFFWAKNKITENELEKKVKEMEAALKVANPYKPSAENLEKQAMAAGQLLACIKDIGDAVLLVGRVLIIKTTQQGQPSLSVITLSHENARKMDEHPEFLVNPQRALQLLEELMKVPTMKKTILELDLVGYSDVARMLEQSLGPESVFALNQSMQGFITLSLAAVDLDWSNTVLTLTGDGAILAFDHAEQAHRFAEAVHFAAKEHNTTKTELSAKRVFRTGAATGEIYLQSIASGGFNFSGITVADAVRLEAQAKPGELLIDNATFFLLPDSLKHRYHSEEEVRGKRNEVYKAHRYTIDPEAPKQLKVLKDDYSSRTSFGTGDEFEDSSKIWDLLEALEHLCNFSGAIKRIMLAMSMPVPLRPPDTLPCAEQSLKLFEWVQATNKVENLKNVIQLCRIKYGVQS